VSDLAQVIALPRRTDQDPVLTYQQLARELDVSVRFLQYRVEVWMPVVLVFY
jgi:hypothetical protein